MPDACHGTCSTHLSHVLHIDLVTTRLRDHSQGTWDEHMRSRTSAEFLNVATADLPCAADLLTVLRYCQAHQLFDPHDPRWQEFGWDKLAFPNGGQQT
jgi:hypothetical protein